MQPSADASYVPFPQVTPEILKTAAPFIPQEEVTKVVSTFPSPPGVAQAQLLHKLGSPVEAQALEAQVAEITPESYQQSIAAQKVSTELTGLAERRFQRENARLDTGEYVSRSFYDSLTLNE